MKTVILITGKNCSGCAEIKTKLKNDGIQYKEYDIESARFAAWFRSLPLASRKTIKLGVPQIFDGVEFKYIGGN